ncbi:hypothetical protein P0W64_07675 [Tsukamurella sp. 8F]|uniref:hypothetical protein n=1 Tax=unclassified Tsukamurella TaxID=2633480 RepID=UPI0023B97541|nr:MULTISPECIES: hypothetical protein [unclassified Tsukamurella]MDF0528813.1 hypothetical protein [Tsukamurella sp. 8J]MDF0586648.1 hypothetical protein [Tsukamurella sp. 8F]
MTKLFAGPVLRLYVLAPLIGEFFLGDFPVVLLPLLVVLAPWYGAAALLIREVARRRGLGWPSIAALALAWAVVGEGLLGQSLFNPGYAGAHLLDRGYVPALGIGATWTVFVLSIHVAFSMCLPIGIVELGMPDHHRPLLRRRGIGVCVLLLLVGAVVTFSTAYQTWGHFTASWPHLLGAAVVAVVLIAVALYAPARAGHGASSAARTTSPADLFAILFACGAALLGGVRLPTAVGLVTMAGGVLSALGVFAVWVRRRRWTDRHSLAAIAAGLLTYGWSAPIRLWGHTTADHVLAVASGALYILAELAVIAWLHRVIARRGE